MKIMSSATVDDKNITPVIKIDGEVFQYKSIKRGGSQVCVTHPALFNNYSEIVLCSIDEFHGVNVGDISIDDLHTKNDTALKEESETNLHAILDNVTELSSGKRNIINN